MNSLANATPVVVTSLVLAGAVGLATLTARADAPPPADPPAGTSAVRVNVGTFRNQKGTLGCRLFRAGNGFPEEHAGTVERTVPITATVTGCAFDGLTPGRYAVAVIHDENGNGKLDKNFFGVPTEGYGVSNNHTYALSAPTWAESSFVVEAGKDVALGIALRY